MSAPAVAAMLPAPRMPYWMGRLESGGNAMGANPTEHATDDLGDLSSLRSRQSKICRCTPVDVS